jgi:hypothetical protein
MVTVPYLNVSYIQQNVVSKYGTGSTYYSGQPYYKVFTDDQLRVLTDIICELMQGYMSTLAVNVDQAIREGAPTGQQIHQLFLDELLKHEQK